MNNITANANETATDSNAAAAMFWTCGCQVGYIGTNCGTPDPAFASSVGAGDPEPNKAATTANLWIIPVVFAVLLAGIGIFKIRPAEKGSASFDSVLPVGGEGVSRTFVDAETAETMGAAPSQFNNTIQMLQAVSSEPFNASSPQVSTAGMAQPAPGGEAATSASGGPQPSGISAMPSTAGDAPKSVHYMNDALTVRQLSEANPMVEPLTALMPMNYVQPLVADPGFDVPMPTPYTGLRRASVTSFSEDSPMESGPPVSRMLPMSQAMPPPPPPHRRQPLNKHPNVLTADSRSRSYENALNIAVDDDGGGEMPFMSSIGMPPMPIDVGTPIMLTTSQGPRPHSVSMQGPAKLSLAQRHSYLEAIDQPDAFLRMKSVARKNPLYGAQNNNRMLTLVQTQSVYEDAETDSIAGSRPNSVFIGGTTALESTDADCPRGRPDSVFIGGATDLESSDADGAAPVEITSPSRPTLSDAGRATNQMLSAVPEADGASDPFTKPLGTGGQGRQGGYPQSVYGVEYDFENPSNAGSGRQQLELPEGGTAAPTSSSVFPADRSDLGRLDGPGDDDYMLTDGSQPSLTELASMMESLASTDPSPAALDAFEAFVAAQERLGLAGDPGLVDPERMRSAVNAAQSAGNPMPGADTEYLPNEGSSVPTNSSGIGNNTHAVLPDPTDADVEAFEMWLSERGELPPPDGGEDDYLDTDGGPSDHARRGIPEWNDGDEYMATNSVPVSNGGRGSQHGNHGDGSGDGNGSYLGIDGSEQFHQPAADE